MSCSSYWTKRRKVESLVEQYCQDIARVEHNARFTDHVSDAHDDEAGTHGPEEADDGRNFELENEDKSLDSDIEEVSINELSSGSESNTRLDTADHFFPVDISSGCVLGILI